MVKKLVGKLLKKKSFYGVVLLGAALYFGSGSIGPVSSPSSYESKEIKGAVVSRSGHGVVLYRTRKHERAFSRDPAPSSNGFSISTYKPLTRTGDEQEAVSDLEQSVAAEEQTSAVMSVDLAAYRSVQETPQFQFHYMQCKDDPSVGAYDCLDSSVKKAAKETGMSIYK